MSCNSKINTLDYLKDKGILELSNVVMNKNAFAIEVSNLSEIGRKNYGIVGIKPFNNTTGRAIPNEKFFNAIDAYNESIKIPHVDPFSFEKVEDTNEFELNEDTMTPEQKQQVLDNEKSESVYAIEKKAKERMEARYLGKSGLAVELDQAIFKLHDFLKRAKNEEKDAKFRGQAGVAYRKISKEIISKSNKAPKALNKITGLNYAKSVLSFYSFLNNESKKTLEDLHKNINKKGISPLRQTANYRNAKTYLDSFSIIEEVNAVLHSLNNLKGEDRIITKSQYEELEGLYKEIKSETSKLETALADLRETILVNSHGNTRYYKEVLIRHKTEAEKRAKDQFPGRKNKGKRDEYVLDYVTENAEEIEKETREEFRNLLRNPSYDISSITGNMLSDANINNPFIQIAYRIIGEAEVNYKNNVQRQLAELNALQKEHNMTKENFKNITEKDHKGVTYLKGKYKAEYFSRAVEVEKNLRNAQGDKRIAEAKEARKKFYEENTDPTGKGPRVKPSAKWENDLTTLSESEKIFLAKFTKITNDNNTAFGNKMSLIKKSKQLKRPHIAMAFHQVPKQLETNFGKFMRGDILGGLKKTYEAFTKKEIDDVDEALSVKEQARIDGKNKFVERTHQDLAGNEKNSLNINYRNEVLENQNMDLLTVYAKEIENAAKYKANKSIEESALMIAESAKDKEFFRTKGFWKKLNIAFGKDVALKDYAVIEGENSEVYKKLVSMMENNVYEITSKYAGEIGGKDINRLTGSFIAYASYLGMALKIPGAVNNFFLGTISNFIEQTGGEFTTGKDTLRAHRIYASNFAGILNDVGRPFKTNFVNQLMSVYDTMGDYSQLNNQYERNNRAKQLGESSTLFSLYSMGEHEMQGTLFLSIAEGTKVLNKDKKYIDINGKVVANKKDAASLIDMYELNEDGVIAIRKVKKFTGENSKKNMFSYTSVDLMNEFDKGGETSVKALVKDRIFRAHGIYDTKRQSDFQRNFYGKLFLHYKKYFESALLNRFRGVSEIRKDTDALQAHQKYYNYSTLTEEYGYLTTFLRNIIAEVKANKFNIIAYATSPNRAKRMSNHEVANIRKAKTELGIIVAMIGLSYTFAAAAADDEDNDLLWEGAYFARRIQNELTQYFLPGEMIRIAKAPIASMAQFTVLSKLLGVLIPPYGEVYKTGDNAGKSKDLMLFKKAVLPKAAILGYDVKYRKMYNYFDSLD